MGLTVFFFKFWGLIGLDWFGWLGGGWGCFRFFDLLFFYKFWGLIWFGLVGGGLGKAFQAWRSFDHTHTQAHAHMYIGLAWSVRPSLHPLACTNHAP